MGIISLSSNAQDNSGNTTTTDNGSTQSTGSSTLSGNVTPPTADAIAAIQQQRQTLAQQLMDRVQSASPDDRLASIVNYRQQMTSLLAALQPPPLSQDQQAQLDVQKAATMQAFTQSLPAFDQATTAAMQQRQQLLQQMANATPDQKLALISQVRQLAAQQAQTLAASPHPFSSDADQIAAIDAGRAAWVASQPPQDQSAMQAMVQRQQAIQAAMQLSPDDRIAALQAIHAQSASVATVSAPSNSTSTTTGNSASITTSDSSSSTTSPTTQPTSQP